MCTRKPERCFWRDPRIRRVRPDRRAPRDLKETEDLRVLAVSGDPREKKESPENRGTPREPFLCPVLRGSLVLRVLRGLGAATARMVTMELTETEAKMVPTETTVRESPRTETDLVILLAHTMTWRPRAARTYRKKIGWLLVTSRSRRRDI
jgi:hypothetical protein